MERHTIINRLERLLSTIDKRGQPRAHMWTKVAIKMAKQGDKPSDIMSVITHVATLYPQLELRIVDELEPLTWEQAIEQLTIMYDSNDVIVTWLAYVDAVVTNELYDAALRHIRESTIGTFASDHPAIINIKTTLAHALQHRTAEHGSK